VSAPAKLVMPCPVADESCRDNPDACTAATYIREDIHNAALARVVALEALVYATRQELLTNTPRRKSRVRMVRVNGVARIADAGTSDFTNGEIVVDCTIDEWSARCVKVTEVLGLVKGAAQ
jgi:hypothetical protein